MKNKVRPETTLFLLTSVDGKISTGSGNKFDFDKDLCRIPSTKKGLDQYYTAEQETDKWSLNSGKVMMKVGWGSGVVNPSLKAVTFVVIDNCWLSSYAVSNLLQAVDKLFIITTNPYHPAQKIAHRNLFMINQVKLNLLDAFHTLYIDFGCDSLTIQTGGTLNSLLFKERLVDNVHIIMAPIIVRGKATPTICDGESIQCIEQVSQLNFESCKVLEHSYIELKYSVINSDN